MAKRASDLVSLSGRRGGESPIIDFLAIATGRPPLKPASGHCQQSRTALRIARDNSRTPKRFQAFYVRSAVVLIWGIGLKTDKSAGFGYFDLIRCLSGLSPRVRGNPLHDLPQSTQCRSIPACAGEPDIEVVGELKNGVYPRVCGGTRYQFSLPLPGLGLSPRVRGNQEPPGPSANPHRSIPACAGEPR